MKGNKDYRFLDNPKEMEFHDKFIKMFNRDSMARKTLSGVIHGWVGNHPKEYLSEKEEIIYINLIQWLGSSVGQGFLSDCGFTDNNLG